jgi:hypothetical protein
MCKLWLCNVIPAILALASVGNCQAPSGTPKGDSTATYLQSLSDEERKDYEALKAEWDKMRGSDATQLAKWQDKMVLMAQVTLGRFGYGTKFTAVLDQATQEALRTYQAYKGIPVSGQLDSLTFFALTDDDKIADQHFVDFGDYQFLWRDGYFSGTGAWDRLNDSEYSVRSTQLECEKDTCVETDAVETTVLQPRQLLRFGRSSR